MHREDTYSLAHTARCKLQLAAGRPDRNLRFILGHAFTLDKLNLRLAEIETDESYDEDLGDESGSSGEVNYCTLSSDLVAGGGDAHAKESTPSTIKNPIPNSRDDLEEDDEAEDDNLSLQRFRSASERPPQMVRDDESESDSSSPSTTSSDEEEYNFDFADIMPSRDEMRIITAGSGDAQLKDWYQHVAKCPCHGKKGEDVERMWKVPQREGQPQIAIIQASA
ncbi:hypothetical protein B7463_g3273, partial [Scytalidium lignicola]